LLSVELTITKVDLFVLLTRNKKRRPIEGKGDESQWMAAHWDCGVGLVGFGVGRAHDPLVLVRQDSGKPRIRRGCGLLALRTHASGRGLATCLPNHLDRDVDRARLSKTVAGRGPGS
jgi:hypothetical protein